MDIIESGLFNFTFYDKLKDKFKKYYREEGYFNEAVNIIMSMFVYKNLPQATSKTAIEQYLMSGACAMTCDGKVWNAEPKKKLSSNFEYNEVFLNDFLGSTKSATNNNDCVVGYNNYLKTPSYFVSKFAYDMSQIDLSMSANLRYARMNKGFKVSNDKEKNIYKEAIKKANEGEEVIIVSNNISDFVENGSDNTFNLTDVEKIDRLQYLSNFREDTIKNFWRRYGLNMNGFTKLAQQSESEINDSAIFSMTLPCIMLECRKEFINKCNDMFGFNIEVDFSELWKRQLTDATEKENGENENENKEN